MVKRDGVCGVQGECGGTGFVHPGPGWGTVDPAVFSSTVCARRRREDAYPCQSTVKDKLQ